MARLFISQERLDIWTSEGKVHVDGDIMTLIQAGQSFRISSAVRFLEVAGDEEDPHGLLGTVRDEETLAVMGADHMASSVIYVDTAYDVQNGFIGELVSKS